MLEFRNFNPSHVEFDLNKLGDNAHKSKQNRLTKKASRFFNITKVERNKKGQLEYANNRNSKGRLVPVLCTLTYPSNDDWQPDDLSKFLKKYTAYAKYHFDIKLRYFWVAETTKKGVLHYHIVFWIPRNGRLPKPSEPLIYNNRTYPAPWKYWAKIEGVKKGVYKYLVKYMSKSCYDFECIFKPKLDQNGNQLVSEKTGKLMWYRPRIFGYGGLTKNSREILRFLSLPFYLRLMYESLPFGTNIVRQKGGWLVKRDNIIDTIGYSRSRFKQYYQYGFSSILSNFEITYSELNGENTVIYSWGYFWSYNPNLLLLDESPIFYPF